MGAATQERGIVVPIDVSELVPSLKMHVAFDPVAWSVLIAGGLAIDEVRRRVFDVCFMLAVSQQKLGSWPVAFSVVLSDTGTRRRYAFVADSRGQRAVIALAPAHDALHRPLSALPSHRLSQMNRDVAGYFTGRIEIGGPLDQEQAAALLDLLLKELGSADEVAELVEKSLVARTVLTYEDDEARDGAFVDLEQGLVATKIPFSRESGTSNGYYFDLSVFTGEQRGQIMVDYESEPYVPLGALVKALNDGTIDELLVTYSLANWSPDPIAATARAAIPVHAALGAFKARHAATVA